MKKFVLLYRGGDVPQEQMEENMQEWGAYVAEMVKRGAQKSGLPFAGGKVVTSGSVEDYKAHKDDVAGYSEIEVESIDQAIEAAKMAPNIKHGGSVEIREAMEMDMPGM